MKLFGFSPIFWIVVFFLVIFGSYFFKTIYGSLYRMTTGNSLGSSFYNNTKYGQPDYAYALGKAIFSV
jgi:predicted permease